jgi:hypothetical protein
VLVTQKAPISHQWTPSPTEIADQILGAVTVAPRSGSYIAALFPSVDTATVVRTLNELQYKKALQLDNNFNYCLAPAAVSDTFVPSLKELTLHIPIGVLRDLKRYAKTQGTSVEMEAAYLLSEIVRVYKAQSVIPNT